MLIPGVRGPLQVFQYRDSGLILDNTLGSDIVIKDTELVAVVAKFPTLDPATGLPPIDPGTGLPVVDPVTGLPPFEFNMFVDPGLYTDVECLFYRHTKPPLPEV